MFENDLVLSSKDDLVLSSKDDLVLSSKDDNIARLTYIYIFTNCYI